MANHLAFGFKFMPTEEELVDFYLRKRLDGSLQQNNLITDVDVYKFDPEILIDEGYYFTKRDCKYGAGHVVNRNTGGGFWKMTSSVKNVIRSSDGTPIGRRHVLKYFRGTPSNKTSTNWLMHEFEMAGDPNKFQDMVLCKIYEKGAKKIDDPMIDLTTGLEDEVFTPQRSWDEPAAYDQNQTFDPAWLLSCL